MFDALKKKFSQWIGKKEEKPIEKPKPSKSKAKEKPVKKVIEKEKPKEEKKQKIKREKPSKERLEEERKTTEKLFQDIKEEGIDITSPNVVVDKAIEELKRDSETEEEKHEEVKEEERKKSWWPFSKKKKDEKGEIKEETPEVKAEESFFSKLVNKISSSKLKDEDFEDAFHDLEITLLENNTSLEAVDKIKESLKQSLVQKDIRKGEIEKTIFESLKTAILSVLIEPPNLIEQINAKEGIYTILFFGINGSGKTTSIAKLAYMLKEKGISSVLAAGDTFRAASIEQLETHAERIGVPIIKSKYGSDPASVAFEARKYAEAHKIKVVLIDTAGRMYTKSNLMKEMEKIVRISRPDLKIFVGESITGNDATEQAKTFNETAGIDGIILSKADIDEKAGTILSVSQVTNKPIYFLGTGQEYKDLTPFTKKEILKNLGLD